GISSSGTSFQPGSVSATAGDIVVSGLLSEAATASINDAFTITDQSTSYILDAFAYLYAPSTGAINPTWSWAGASVVAANIAVFKPANSPTLFTSSGGLDETTLEGGATA